MLFKIDTIKSCHIKLAFTLFMYDTYSYKCTHDMHKYDIKYNEDCFYNNKV